MEKIIKVRHTVTQCEHSKQSIRIINIGDIHFGMKTSLKRVKRPFQLASTLNPDYICLLGDNIDTTNIIDSDKKRDEFISLLEYSASISPTMISLASHDQRYRNGDGTTIHNDKNDFWKMISMIPNIHVLNNSWYRDKNIQILGYTQPNYYFHGDAPLPLYSKCSRERTDEDVDVLIENLKINRYLLKQGYGNCSVILFHSPKHMDNTDVRYHLRDFNYIFSAHMHNGCVFPVLDELMPGIIGLVSPQRELFPSNCRGIIRTAYGSLCIINGGITKIHESAKAVLQPFNKLFPMHMDVVDIIPSEEDNKGKYKQKSYYKYIK